MKKTSLVVAMLVVSVAGAAEAGGQANTIGVGAEAQLNGIGGASLNYDAGDFHVGGFLGYHDPGNRDDEDTLLFGGRFFYHVHQTTTSDFGVGGTFGYVSDNNPQPRGRESYLYVEPAVQIRVFLVANVALSFNVGVTIGTMDAENVDLGGQLVGGSLTVNDTQVAFGGGAGVHYYFF